METIDVSHVKRADLNNAFCDLKEMILKAPVLHKPNYKYPLKLSVDASRSEYGCLLFQDIPVDSREPKSEIIQEHTVATVTNGMELDKMRVSSNFGGDDSISECGFGGCRTNTRC
jgi:hypothetical protein